MPQNSFLCVTYKYVCIYYRNLSLTRLQVEHIHLKLNDNSIKKILSLFKDQSSQFFISKTLVVSAELRIHRHACFLGTKANDTGGEKNILILRTYFGKSFAYY